jgi:hypothetical protein
MLFLMLIIMLRASNPITRPQAPKNLANLPEAKINNMCFWNMYTYCVVLARSKVSGHKFVPFSRDSECDRYSKICYNVT